MSRIEKSLAKKDWNADFRGWRCPEVASHALVEVRVDGNAASLEDFQPRPDVGGGLIAWRGAAEPPAKLAVVLTGAEKQERPPNVLFGAIVALVGALLAASTAPWWWDRLWGSTEAQMRNVDGGVEGRAPPGNEADDVCPEPTVVRVTVPCDAGEPPPPPPPPPPAAACRAESPMPTLQPAASARIATCTVRQGRWRITGTLTATTTTNVSEGWYRQNWRVGATRGGAQIGGEQGLVHAERSTNSTIPAVNLLIDVPTPGSIDLAFRTANSTGNGNAEAPFSLAWSRGPSIVRVRE